MNYWIICLPRPDLEHCMRIGTFGRAGKHILGRVSKGDKVVCCSGKGEWKIIGLGTVVSDYYMDDTNVFLKEGHFPDRFDFSSEKLAPNGAVDLMSIIEKLSFVTNLAYWAVFFRNGIAQMSEKDWRLICEVAKDQTSAAK